MYLKNKLTRHAISSNRKSKYFPITKLHKVFETLLHYIHIMKIKEWNKKHVNSGARTTDSLLEMFNRRSRYIA